MSPKGVPSNGQDPILIKTDFKFSSNSKEILDEYANYTCRFFSPSTNRVIYTQGEATSIPYVYNAVPTHIWCLAPIWEVEEGKDKEIV